MLGKLFKNASWGSLLQKYLVLSAFPTASEEGSSALGGGNSDLEPRLTEFHPEIKEV